ncbi:MAG: hypothetical protein IH986_00715 [Planctomycetes bacterium]|nr:hypothetical protein [Planctomycetota bacterium]
MCEGEDIPADAPRCPECGYLLYGLAEWRCPECGCRPRPEDFVHDEMQDRLRSIARRERIISLIGITALATGLLLTAIAQWRWDRMWIYCVDLPLIGSSGSALIYVWVVSDTMHRALLAFGLVWLAFGLFWILV